MPMSSVPLLYTPSSLMLDSAPNREVFSWSWVNTWLNVRLTGMVLVLPVGVPAAYMMSSAPVSVK